MAKKYGPIQKSIIESSRVQLELSKRPLMVRVEEIRFKDGKKRFLDTGFIELPKDIDESGLVKLAEKQIKNENVELNPFTQYRVDVGGFKIYILTYNKARGYSQTIILNWSDIFYDIDEEA